MRNFQLFHVGAPALDNPFCLSVFLYFACFSIFFCLGFDSRIGFLLKVLGLAEFLHGVTTEDGRLCMTISPNLLRKRQADELEVSIEFGTSGERKITLISVNLPFHFSLLTPNSSALTIVKHHWDLSFSIFVALYSFTAQEGSTRPSYAGNICSKLEAFSTQYEALNETLEK